MWPFRDKHTIEQRVEVLTLRPDDFLVMETRERISRDDVEHIREQFSHFTGLDGNRVIVVYNATLKVLRHGDPPPPPVIVEPGTRW